MMTVVIILLVVTIVLLLGLLFLIKDIKQPKTESRLDSIIAGLEKSERSLREELAGNRKELAGSLKDFGDSSSKQMVALTRLNEQKLDSIRETVEKRLKSLQDDNSKKLDQMRQTVDEKLHDTLEKRLGQSFKLVQDRLEQVHKGLGAMQELAVGVGDLKKVLANVKTRGIMGEIQLGNLLEQVLTIDQYDKNVNTKEGSRDHVEFAIKLPGRGDKPVWLPVDAKFPLAEYQRLQEAQDQADRKLVEDIGKELEKKIKTQAKEIRDKYIDPPNTTDFAIMFLPVEGLYAEVLRRPGLYDSLQRDYHVVITGPTTIAAFLSSLQIGFKTLAIGKQASEVWDLLEAVKNEFGKFGGILEKADKQLQTVSTTISEAASKTRTIERKLDKVGKLPRGKQDELLE